MPEVLELSNEDKYVIAEFVYSYGSDILILSDATKAVETLFKNDLIEEDEKNNLLESVKKKHAGIATKIMVLIHDKIPEEIGVSIMTDYHAGKLP